MKSRGVFLIALVLLSLVLFSSLHFVKADSDRSDDSNDDNSNSGSDDSDDDRNSGSDRENSSDNESDDNSANFDDDDLENDDSNRVEIRERARIIDSEGKEVRYEIRVRERADGTTENRVRIETREVSSEIETEVVEESGRTVLKTQLSNGRNAEIKIMPETAAETALERLRLKVCAEEAGCTMTLKEVGTNKDENDDGEEDTAVAYEIRVEKEAKILNLFRTRMQIRTEVNAETGEVIDTERPWWSFMASESDESLPSSEPIEGIQPEPTQ